MHPRSLYFIDSSKKKEYTLQVGEPLSHGEYHKLYIAELGNPKGFPAVFFHGGPGDGCKDAKAAIFNPEFYRIILIDQRGAGKSTPKGCLEQNTTADLIADMEAVRKFLNIKKWLIAGTSWGTALALLYAQKHPETVAALILRGIFLARAQDINSYLQDGSPAALMKAREWEEFKKASAELFSQAGMPEPGMIDTNKTYKELYLSLLNDFPELRQQAASNYLSWLKLNLSLAPKLKSPPPTADEVARLHLELSYQSQKFYIDEANAILKNMQVIIDAKIPVHIIHGYYDLICLTNQADALQQALPPELVTRTNVVAGHTSEYATDKAMVAKTQVFAREYNEELRRIKTNKPKPLYVAMAVNGEGHVTVELGFDKKKISNTHASFFNTGNKLHPSATMGDMTTLVEDVQIQIRRPAACPRDPEGHT